MAELLDTTRLAISDFALVRQSRWREAIASTFDDPDFLPYLRSIRRIAVTYGTHDETGAPGSTNLVKPDLSRRLAGVAPRAAGGRSRWRRRRTEAVAAERGAGVRAPGAKPALGRGLVATLSDGRADVAVVVRPVVSTMPAGHHAAGRAPGRAPRLGAAGRRDRGGRDRPRPRLAGRGGGARPALPCAARGPTWTCWPRRSRPSGRDPVAIGALRSAAALVARRDDDDAGRAIDRWRDAGRRSSSWPTRPPCAPEAAEQDRSAARRRRSAARGRADWATTGGSTVVGDLPAAGRGARGATRAVGPPSTSGGATTDTCRATTRSRTSSRSTTSSWASPGPRKGRPEAERPERADRGASASIRSGPARRSAQRPRRGLVRRGARRGAPRRRPATSRRLAGHSTWSCSGSVPTATCCRSSRGRRRSIRASWRWRSRLRPTSSPMCERRDAQPGGDRRCALRPGGGRRLGEGPGPWRHLRPDLDPDRWPAQLALRDVATWVVDAAAAANLPRA